MLLKTKKLSIILAFSGGMFFCQPVLAQDSIVLDSLHALIPNTPHRDLLSVYNRVASVLDKMDHARALGYAKGTLHRATQHGDLLAQAYALRNLAQVYAAMSNKGEALRCYQEAMARARDAREPFGMAVTLYDLGVFQNHQGLYAEGLRQVLDASKLFEDLHEYNYVVKCHAECSSVHFKARNYQLSIEEGYRALDYLEKVDPSGLSTEQDFERMTIFNTIALANGELQQYDEAISNYDRSEQYARRLNNEFWIGLINGNKASILKRLGRTEEAIRSIVYDLRTSRKFQVWTSAASAAIQLSEIYMDRRDYTTARLYLDTALAMYGREPDKMVIRRGMAHFRLAQARLQAGMGDYDRAYAELSNHVSLRDSLYREQEAITLARLRASYDLDRKQTEIELLTKNNEIQQERLRSQRTLFAASLAGVVLLSVLVINLVVNFRRQRAISALIRRQHHEIETKNAELSAQSAQLQENNQYIQALNHQLEKKVIDRTLALEAAIHDLDTFLYRSSHDMRRPITTLLGLDLVARYAVKDEQALMLFSKVVETARSMDGMLYKMQMVYELNKTDFQPESINLNSLVDECVHHFRPELERFHITHHILFPGFVIIQSSASLLTIIFRNLLENAIMFRKDQPGTHNEITIRVTRSEGTLELLVADNGMGVEDNYKAKIFDLYFRASPASKGNGLGLYLVSKAVHKLQGSISMQSDFGVGTAFSIRLPLA